MSQDQRGQGLFTLLSGCRKILCSKKQISFLNICQFVFQYHCIVETYIEVNTMYR